MDVSSNAQKEKGMESRTTRSFFDSIGLDVGPDGFEIAWKPRQRPKSLDAWSLPTRAPDLSTLPGFSSADVQANLERTLTVDQRSALHTHLGRLGLAGAGGLWISVIGFVATGFSIGTVFGLVWLAIVGYHVLNAVQDLRGAVVASSEGDVWKQRESDEGTDSYYLRVNRFKLETERAVYERIVSGGPYRIFYLPLSERVVGGEPLPGWRALSQAERPSGIGRE
jgi:hypothetical protein